MGTPLLQQNTRSRAACIPLRAGFTLVEVLIAMAISAVILGAVMTTYVSSMKHLAVASNYGVIEREGRQAVDLFSRDVRGASGIAAFSSTNITVRIPITFSSTGSVVSNKTVAYWLSQTAVYRYELQGAASSTKVVATNVNQMILSLYDSAGNSTASTNSAKGIQMNLYFSVTTVNQTQSWDCVSARLEMRNKH